MSISSLENFQKPCTHFQVVPRIAKQAAGRELPSFNPHIIDLCQSPITGCEARLLPVNDPAGFDCAKATLLRDDCGEDEKFHLRTIQIETAKNPKQIVRLK